jgi:hypothetical protein
MLLITKNENGYQLEKYLNYLRRIEGSLPEGVRSFALAPWHYDQSDSKCPHDGWMESLILQELAEGDRREVRGLGIVATFLGAFHDGVFEITYRDVQSYTLSLQGSKNPSATIVHGDWIVDEILLTENGLVSHEVEFSQLANWKIVCRDIVYRWRNELPHHRGPTP